MTDTHTIPASTAIEAARATGDKRLNAARAGAA